jgi:hypothetical protein
MLTYAVDGVITRSGCSECERCRLGLPLYVLLCVLLYVLLFVLLYVLLYVLLRKTFLFF